MTMRHEAIPMAERLKELRAVAKVSCLELDRLAGLTRGMTSYAESSQADVSSARAAAWAGVFGVSLDWLVTGKGKRPKDAHVVRSVKAAKERMRRRAA